MKELPKVYVNPIDKEVKNNTDLFYSKLLDSKKDQKSVLKQIDEIFASRSFVYKSKVHVVTREKEFDTTLVGRNGASLLTLDNEKIPIIDIMNIKKI